MLTRPCCRRNSKAMQRLAVQKQDDWARIMALQARLAELRGAQTDLSCLSQPLMHAAPQRWHCGDMLAVRTNEQVAEHSRHTNLQPVARHKLVLSASRRLTSRCRCLIEHSTAVNLQHWQKLLCISSMANKLRVCYAEVEQRKTVVQKQSALRATLDRQKEEQEVYKKRDEEEREEARLAIAEDLDKFRSSEEQKRQLRDQATAARKVGASCRSARP